MKRWGCFCERCGRLHASVRSPTFACKYSWLQVTVRITSPSDGVRLRSDPTIFSFVVEGASVPDEVEVSKTPG